MHGHLYHFLYKTTNIKNNKFYIGIHSTSDLNDGYTGSGKKIRNSVRYWGRENHKFEILEFFPNRDLLSNKEKEVVNEELLRNPKCMNIALGGDGCHGFINEEHMKKCCQAGNEALKEKLKDPEYKKQFAVKSKSAETWKRLHRGGYFTYDTFSGKSHSAEAKNAIGKANSEHQKGQKNSQFGKIWIRNLETSETLRITPQKLEDYVALGWERGRLMEVPRKLTEDTVRSIKSKLAEGIDCVSIAKLFSTTPSTVKSIKRQESWGWVKP
jgi:hypothetical protein